MKSSTLIAAAAGLLMLATGCDKTKSYSELLTEEEHAVNWYLAKNEVELDIPKDSVFITGTDAPFYKMNSEGSVYMRVINPGDKSKMVKDNDRVYFTFMRMNIKDYFEGKGETWIGNMNNMVTSSGGTSFFFGNNTLTSSTKYGTGIQIPLNYLGLYSEVELVIKAIQGFSEESNSNQIYPYAYKVKYYPALY